MASNLTISPVAVLPGDSTPGRATPLVTPEPASKAVPSLPNPTLHLDPDLGVSVVQFRDGTGAVVRTIPTARQLQAYRDGTVVPNSTHKTSSATTPVAPDLLT